MADSNQSTAVMPDGKLGRCESCINGAIWGSIYSGKADEEVLRQWKERRPSEDLCKACAVYPQCIRLKKCPNWPEHCTPIERAYREEKIIRAILGSYEEWRASRPSGERIR